MTTDRAIIFLYETAKYFESLSVKTNEDIEFWAYVNNAENCRKIASIMEEMRREIQTLSGR